MTEGEARVHHTKKILFVCTANICRSPMAEAMFNALAEDKVLAWRAESAGVAALIEEEIAPHARMALEEVGIYTEGHRARRVSEEMLGEADLVLTMGPRHMAALRGSVGASGILSGQHLYPTGVRNRCFRRRGNPRPLGAHHDLLPSLGSPASRIHRWRYEAS